MKKVDKNINTDNASWTFEDISDEFENHVSKSVPFYHESHQLAVEISDFFVKENSLIYDIGVSTGLLSRLILKRHQRLKDLKLIGIDNVNSMITKARAMGTKDKRATYICDDIINYPLEKSNLIIAFYTIQFIPPQFRQDVINKIFDSLNWGGAFLMFEKVRANDARFQDYMSQMYIDFKLSKGFEYEEIINKSRSLKGILEPFSTNGNLELLNRAGFKDITSVFKWACFEGFLAIK